MELSRAMEAQGEPVLPKGASLTAAKGDCTPVETPMDIVEPVQRALSKAGGRFGARSVSGPHNLAQPGRCTRYGALF